nr:hypothetical protein [Anaerolineae bacterium]
VLLFLGQFADVSAGTIGSVIIGLGITAIIVSIVLGLGHLASDLLSFDLSQVLALGAVFVVVGLFVRNWLSSTERINVPQRIAWTTIVLGIAQIIIGVIASNNGILGFSGVQLVALGVVFVVVGILLLIIFSGVVDATPPPMAQLRTTPVRSSAPPAPNMPKAVVPPPIPTIIQATPVAPAPTPAPLVRATTKRDDLLIIEGIGPKSKEALYKGGITTFEQIANLSPDDLYRIVKIEGGVNLVNDTKTWPKQARLLADGKMKEFEEYVKYLVNSRGENTK